jgi:hypothetical protein
MKPLKDMTDTDLREAHRALWEFMVNNPDKQTHDFFLFGRFVEENIPRYYCYVCAFANRALRKAKTYASRCNFCPCDWGPRWRKGARLNATRGIMVCGVQKMKYGVLEIIYYVLSMLR